MSIRKIRRAALYGSAAGAALLALAAPVSALAQSVTYTFDIPPQDVGSALIAYGRTARQQLVFDGAAVRDRQSQGLSGDYSAQDGLQKLLDGTGLKAEFAGSGAVRILAEQGGSGPQSAGAGGDVDALIVTAQKREENIQDVPIAISAFSQEDLTRSQVAGGPDLMTQVPNMTFTKTNFSSYSIQIRGIGTQAISATTDAAVAVAFNNTPFIRNRFFEQEFYDLQRAEVLRGPQGTLYGRNATAGVVNLISAKPSLSLLEAKASADIANYSSKRVDGMVNIPLVEDIAALRIAGAWTKRDGFVTNQITGNPIDGRDLWSTRLSLRVAPTDKFEANLIWEHFQENDDRLRSGKQLCHRDVVTEINGVPVEQNAGFGGAQAILSQGCKPASLYSADSFEAPNGSSIPYYFPLGLLGLPVALNEDPYQSTTQSPDLRVIESTVDPQYRANSNVAELQLRWEITPDLTLSSESGYSTDTLFSLEDYNRFNTRPGVFDIPATNGVFCDPQIGCSDRLVGVDVSSAESRQFSQELRLSSNYDGKFNFSLGANFLRYDTEDKYYVFINTLTLFSAFAQPSNPTRPPPYVPNVTDNMFCMIKGAVRPKVNETQPVSGCIYIDPNPIGNLNDNGHNYFLSRNPYKLISYAAFGEAYYEFTDTLKVTAGLRFTVDKKDAPRIPSWLLAANTVGLPVAEVIKQEWKEPTGRLALDWKPDLSFTDQTLIYASLARGYKAGGSNPPAAGVITYAGDIAVQKESHAHPKTFAPEFVNALEIGTKNTLLDGALTLNADVFYYDYTGYQISQIVDRSASNMNFDAEVWGLEFEGDWRPVEALRLGLKLGYENTSVASGSKAIDLMDRTAGVPGWSVVRPHPTQTSSCILPSYMARYSWDQAGSGNLTYCEWAYLLHVDPGTLDPMLGPTGFDPLTAPNNGEGFDKDLGGNELPNAPHFTGTLTADYTLPLPNDWLMTLHGDLYGQTEAWARIFNTEGYDKLKAYTNVNLAAIFTNDAAGLKVMAYVKNVFDKDSITGAFLNSDDSGLTTNVFLNEPRLFGVRVTKEWAGTGAGWMADPNHTPGAPYPFTVELGGQIQQWSAPYQTIEPSFAGPFTGALDNFGAAQHDIDWGDGREVKLTWRPDNGPWRITAGYRHGRTNGFATAHTEQEIKTVCMFARLEDDSCQGGYQFTPMNTSDASASDREEYQMVDFVVGRDADFGGLERSSLNLGMRYAKFTSITDLETDGIPDAYLPDHGVVFDKYHTAHRHRYQSTLEGRREFQGAGPVLSWEASRRLLGNEEVGHIDADWSLGAGALFGKSDTSITGTEYSSYYEGRAFEATVYGNRVSRVDPPKPVNISRSQSVTVPLVDLSLGLSYEVQRLKLSTGYRWERYFNALDAGVEERRSYDRTIDGPYFKVSVGFGG